MVDIELPHGISHITLEYSGGVSLVLPQVQPHIGDPSHTMKLIDVKLNGSEYIVDAQVDSSQSSNFQLLTDRNVVAVHGATWRPLSADTYELTVPASETSQASRNYRAVQVVVDLGRRANALLR